MKKKKQILRAIMHNANKSVANLAGHLISSPSEKKESILAEIHFNRTVSNLCQVALS